MNVLCNFYRLTTTFIVTASGLTIRPFRTFIVIKNGTSLRRAFNLNATSNRRTVKNTTFRKEERIRVIPMFNNLFIFALRCFDTSSDLTNGRVARYVANAFIFTRLLNSGITNAFRDILYVFSVTFSRHEGAKTRIILTLRRR